VLLAALAGLGVRMLVLGRAVWRARELCRLRWSEMLSAHRAISVQCPRECRPEVVKVECGC
jgi:hypothetical protein